MAPDDAGAPYQAHSRTSRAAADGMAAPADTLRRRVLDYLRAAGAAGATDDEVQVALDMNPSTQRPRRIELVAAGLVYDSGRTRPTRSRRKAVVWVAGGPPPEPEGPPSPSDWLGPPPGP